MILFLKRTILFILVSVVLYFPILFLFGEYVPGILLNNLNYKLRAEGYSNLRLEEVDDENNIDILFLGSSHVYSGIDTRVFSKKGYSCFNLGTSSQSHIQTNVLLNRYLRQLNPKLVVYDVYPDIFMSDGVESAIDIIYNDEVDLLLAKKIIQQNNLKLYNSFFYSLIKQKFDSEIEFTNDEFRDTKYVNGGFVEKRRERKSEKSSIRNDKVWNPKEIQLRHFLNNISIIEGQGCEVLLIQVPVTSNLSELYINKEKYEGFFSKNANYKNFNLQLELDDQSEFYDSRHLNFRGAKKFSNHLLNYIQNKNLIE